MVQMVVIGLVLHLLTLGSEKSMLEQFVSESVLKETAPVTRKAYWTQEPAANAMSWQKQAQIQPMMVMQKLKLMVVNFCCLILKVSCF